MEANNNNDENHHQQHADDDDNAENEDDEDAVVAAVFLKLNTILQRRKKFPCRQRNKIVELAEEYIESLGNDIHEMLCDQNSGENYRGLDSNRDTEAEVETALQFYPHLLSRRKETTFALNGVGEYEWIDAPDGEGHFPIQCLCYVYWVDGNLRYNSRCNLMAVPFIAVLARLAIEFHAFREEERGGLLIENEVGRNTLQELTRSSGSSCDEHYYQFVENICLQQFIQLRRMDLFKKEDIRDCNLYISGVCLFENYFPENLFRLLVEWDPTLLLQTDVDNDLSLHLVVTYSNVIQDFHLIEHSSILVFQVVFDTVIRYYPHKKGICLLFTKNNFNRTPFQIACDQYKYEPVMKIVEDTLTRYAADGAPLHVVDAILTAATNRDVHFDCVYTLLRRHPAILMALLSVQPNNNNDDGEHDDDDDDDADNGNDDDGSPRRIRKKRRT